MLKFKTWASLIIIGLLLLVGCGGNKSPESANDSVDDQLLGAVFDPPRVVEDFTMSSTSGQPFTLSEHRGETILLYFGYLTCPDFCPTTFLELRQVYQALGEPADRIKVVFVTVDPERDTLERLTTYTHGYHEDFIGLRDDGATLEALLDEFGIVVERREVGDSPLAYLIDHTVSIFLIGADGVLQAQYLYGTDYRDIVHDLQLVLATS